MSELSERLIRVAGFEIRYHTSHNPFDVEEATKDTVIAVLRELDYSGQYPPLGSGDTTLLNLAEEIER